ncbi:TIGR00266 family protein [Winogradskyella sp. MH6]|uniref:TIGR00266 family protein n=1 Tax=Winogradskyella sp. MH6 TaxID=2929510 RepID=UPI001FB4F892|nr:TIGR00266 family protein [Winogradskyella sp. MH6]|tara:strand:+ start:9215 stop:10042 length:828 start_codon:yes stop_codon:yes gene_type:complete
MERLPDFTDRNAHEIDYRIYGEEMQYVEIELDPQEAVIAESGSFMMMDDGIKMDTIFGDGSQNDKGFLGKILGAGKRILTGESLFMTAFYNDLTGKRNVSFASPYPGKIIPIDLTEYRGKFICQKDAFLCAAKGVSVGIEFSKKLGRGLFGGEGFIMQKLEGDGMAFVHAGGTMAEKTLQPGETLRVDTGCIVGFTQDVDYDIEFVGGIKNSIFGGEGLFFAKLTGPGKVYIQSLPFSRLADRVIASAPKAGGKSRGEGSILGGLGDLLDGDNRF